MFLKSSIKAFLIILIFLLNITAIGVSMVENRSTISRPEIHGREYQSIIPQEQIVISDISDEGTSRVLTYSSFEQRDTSVQTMNPASVQYIFKTIPAVTVKDLSSKDIPLLGLIDVQDDFKITVPTIQKQQDVVSLDKEGNTLYDAIDIINVDYLRQKFELYGEGQTIAILDSGVGSSSVFFNDENGNTRVSSYNVSGIVENAASYLDYHGSHVAGIAAGNGIYNLDGTLTTTNSMGVAPKADILSIRVLDETGNGANSWMLEGIDYAIASSASVLSLSLSTNMYYGDNDPLRLLVEEANNKGKLIVAAAGNEGPMGSGVGLPGGLESVIGVGAALMEDGWIETTWDASGVGPGVNGYPGPDIIAPGNDILSVNYTTNEIMALSGTSMATPFISGGILLLKEAFPKATIYDIREALLASGVDLGAKVEVQGRGLVDFQKAYELLNETVQLGIDHLPSMPSRFEDTNYYFRNRISGAKKSFQSFLYSNSNATIFPKVDPDSHGVEFELLNNLTIKEGLNSFELNITVISETIEFNYGGIYFVYENNSILPYANISYYSVTRFQTGKILFDTSHDRDTPSSYFANHGPRGQFSKISTVLEAEGYLIEEHTKGNITSDLLEDYDLLVIADPDKNATFFDGEITSIHDFLYKDGKSMLMLVNGGFMSAEELLYEDYNLGQMNEILDGSGIEIDGDKPIFGCGYDLIGDRVYFCPNDAETGNSQKIFPSGIVFPSYGPSLSVIDGTNSEAIAFQDGKAVIAASVLSSGGRILVFSSTVSWDNIGTTTDYEGGGTDVNNRQMARDSISWLLEPRSVKVSYELAGSELPSYVQLSMYKDLKFTISIFDKDNEPVDLGDEPQVHVVYDDLKYWHTYTLNLQKVSIGVYTLTYNFNSYGYYDFYIHAVANDSIPSSGFLSILATLKHQDNAEFIQKTSQLFLFLIMISWFFWIRNEEGSIFKKRK